MAKSVERLSARELRRGGASIREIAAKLGVAKSSVSLWCRDVVLSASQIEKLLHRENVGNMQGRMKAWEWHRREKRVRQAQWYKDGYEKIDVLSKQELFVMGLALYWSEGSKHDGRVLLTNSDPALILIFIRWLHDCFGVTSDMLKCRLTLNASHTERINEVEQYWSSILGIPRTQFTKTTLIKSVWQKRYENRQTYYGVLAVYVKQSTNLSYSIDGSLVRLREIATLMV